MQTVESSDRTLSRLDDKDQIRDLVYAYCQAIDRLDFAKMRKLYHEDARDEHGVNPDTDVEGFIGFIRDFYTGALAIQHHVTNLYIKVDGNYAESEGYVLNTNLIASGAEVVFGGRYLDKYERRNGVWKFLNRRLAADWVNVRENCRDNRATDSSTQNMFLGKPGEQDPSYAYFKLFKRGER